jgi:flagellar hook-associated protein 2
VSTIALPGLSTNIDTAVLVQQLVSAASGPLSLLQARQTRLQQQTSAFATLESRLGALKTALADVRYSADLRAYAAASSDEDAVTVEASSSASEGTHEVIVDRLASADRKVHDGLASLDTTVGAGTFAYSYNGQTRTIQTTADTTLADLRNLINNDGGNPGVTASVLQYDAGGGKVYHLVLGGNDTGADYAIAIDDDLTTLDVFDSTTFTTTQTAQNSRVRVDGYPADPNWIERSGNTLDDVLPGITVHLHATSAGPVRISLTRNTDDLKDKLQALVTAYNNVGDYARQKTAYDAAAKTGGVLMGEYAVTSMLYQLRSPLIEGAPGFLDGTDAFTLAAQIGLSVDRDGKLQLDEETLDEAIAEDYLGVLSLLGARNTGGSDSENLRFYGSRDATTPGTYDVKATFTDGTLTAAWIKAAGQPESAWRAATVNGNLILGADDQPEQGLQVTGSYAGSGTVQAHVRVRQGIGGRLYDTIDEALEDAVDLTQTRYEDEAKLLQDAIEREQERLDKLQQQLTAQFARLEQTLTLLQAQREALTSLTATQT